MDAPPSLVPDNQNPKPNRVKALARVGWKMERCSVRSSTEYPNTRPAHSDFLRRVERGSEISTLGDSLEYFVHDGRQLEVLYILLMIALKIHAR